MNLSKFINTMIIGNVSDTESGLPFVGVKIAVKALNKGVVTDFE